MKKHLVTLAPIFVALAIFSILMVLSGYRIQEYTGDFRRLIAKDSARFGTTDSGASIVFPIKNLASATTLTIPKGSTFALTGTANCTRILAGTPGRLVTFICASTETLTDGVNLKLAGNFSGTADDVIQLVAQDTFWVEVGRSAN